jgi:hypothetical protein
MPNVNIDIPVSDELQQALNGLSCDAISIPKPSPLQVQLPIGVPLVALNDLSKGIPDDCSMSFNLMLQLAPFMASIACLVRLLKVVDALVKMVTGLAKVPPDLSAAGALGAAAADLVEHCIPIVAAIPAFAKDLLCFIRKVLHCVVTNLRSVESMLTSLQVRIADAEGNQDLLDTLNCAQGNALTAIDNLTQAIEPISAFLKLADPIFGIAGMQSISIPTTGASPQSLEALTDLINVLQGVITVIDDMGICAD